ncbi:MAG: pilus assembly protein [Phycisphaerales bacterium]|nr:pilus assembly protein [Phycisphaerales bacterium]
MRRGAAIVELAIVMPFLLLLVFGIIEFGQVAYVRHVLINAATQGARAAILPGATEETVLAVVDQTIRDGRLGGVGSKISRKYTSGEFPDLAEHVLLTVSYADVSLLGFFEDFQLASSATMFRGPLDERGEIE